MGKAEIGGISPCFIVKDVAAAFEFYCDRLGFEIKDIDGYVLYFGRTDSQNT